MRSPTFASLLIFFRRRSSLGSSPKRNSTQRMPSSLLTMTSTQCGCAAQPHCVDVIVSNDDGILCVEFLFGDEPSDDLRRKKMSSDAKVGLRMLEHADHGLRIEAIEREAATWMLPGLVGAI